MKKKLLLSLLSIVAAICVFFCNVSYTLSEDDTEAKLSEEETETKESEEGIEEVEDVQEIIDEIQQEDGGEAYLTYFYYAGATISALADDAYTLAHTPYVLTPFSFNQTEKEKAEEKEFIKFEKAVVSTENILDLTTALRSTSDHSWSTLKDLRKTYARFMLLKGYLDVVFANKPVVPEEYSRIDSVLSSAYEDMNSLETLFVDFYTGKVDSAVMKFWGDCEIHYFSDNVTLIKAYVYFYEE